MRPHPNPFRIRASEHIESDETFLSLFAPGALDLLRSSSDCIWDRVQQFYSTPGGGKTSLFRVFTPGPLATLYRRRDEEDYKDLFQRMRNLGAVSDAGPSVLGVMLSCAQDYATLQDLEVDPLIRQRLFFSLLNARIVISALRNALALFAPGSVENLDELTITVPQDTSLPKRLAEAITPRELYDWACAIEERICTALHSFELSVEALQEHSSLFAFWLLQPGCIRYRGQAVADKAVLMLDDVHRLTRDQRATLTDTFSSARPRVGLWLAERLEGVSPIRVLSPGSTAGREYSAPIVLENFWMSQGNQQRFFNLARSIADRRLRRYPHPKIESDNFPNYIQSSLALDEWQAIADKMRQRLIDAPRLMETYGQWVEDALARGSSAQEQAVILRSLQILIARRERKPQKSLDLDLPVDDVGDPAESGVKASAEFFLYKEFGIPYYYGFPKLVALASWNIEQFLGLAGDLYERVISAKNTSQHTVLDPKQQQSILAKAAQQRWNDIADRVPDGRNVQHFLRAFCEFAVQETNRPNAPYNPGVTGIGIATEDATRLSEAGRRVPGSAYDQLWNVLFNCAAFNLTEVCPNRTQGQKNKTWTVVYLNRWLCVHYQLPTGYGGWRSRSLDDLCRWLSGKHVAGNEPI